MANNVTDKSKQSADTAYEAFDSAREEARELADQAVEAGQESFRQAKSSAKRIWGQARKAGEEWGDRLVESGQDSLDSVKSFAKSRPIQTAAIALVVGVIIGGILAVRLTDSED